MFEELLHCLLMAVQESASGSAACFGDVVVSHIGSAVLGLACFDGLKIVVVGWSEFPCRLDSAGPAAYVASFAVAAVAAEESCLPRSLEILPLNWPSCNSGYIGLGAPR